MRLLSIVTIAIKQQENFLFISKRISDGEVWWGFPSSEFEENLNGDLDDSVNRVLKEFLNKNESRSKVEYLGSHIQKDQENILIGYHFLLENFRGMLKTKDFKWARVSEIENMEIDDNTLIFLRLNGDRI